MWLDTDLNSFNLKVRKMKKITFIILLFFVLFINAQEVQDSIKIEKKNKTDTIVFCIILNVLINYNDETIIMKKTLLQRF